MVKGSIRKSRVSHRVDMACDDALNGLVGVYAIAAYGCCAVKVGWSANIGKRMCSLATGSPFGLSFVGYLPNGTAADEQACHKQLRDWHLRGEWFAWTDEVRNYIAERFVAVADERPDESKRICEFPFRDIEELECVRVVAERVFSKMSLREREYVATAIDGDSSRPMTLEEMARLASPPKKHGMLTRERVRQIVAKASYRFQEIGRESGDESLSAVADVIGIGMLKAHSFGAELDMNRSKIMNTGTGYLVFKERS